MSLNLRGTFQALYTSRNFRWYLGGQSVSLAGTWMQTVAQGWLVLQLSGSGTAVGFVTALQFVPVLFLGPLGGVVVDRLDNRKLLIATQVAAGLLAGLLGILTVSGVVQLWMVYAIAFAFGLVTVVDNPARQTFVLQLAGPESLANAVTLNSVNINAARVVGPAIAAAVIAFAGVGPCFLINAASYLFIVAAMFMMRPSEFHPKPKAPRAKGQVREGFRYVAGNPALRSPLIMMALVGTLTYEFQVILPILAKYTFDGSAGTYGLMTGAMGFGAVFGGLATAHRTGKGLANLVGITGLFGLLVMAVAISPTLPVAVVALVAVGAISIVFLARANTLLQLTADPAMRGRVMALWTVAFLGSTPIGGPIIGYIGEHAGARWGLATGATAALVAAAYGATQVRLQRHAELPVPALSTTAA